PGRRRRDQDYPAADHRRPNRRHRRGGALRRVERHLVPGQWLCRREWQPHGAAEAQTRQHVRQARVSNERARGSALLAAPGSGWGTADVGGAWSSTDPAFSVTPGAGQEITQAYRENDLTAMPATQDVDYLSRLTLPAAPSATCNLTLRRTSTSGSAFYFAGAWWDSGQGKVQLYIKQQDAFGTNSTLAPDTG